MRGSVEIGVGRCAAVGVPYHMPPAAVYGLLPHAIDAFDPAPQVALHRALCAYPVPSIGGGVVGDCAAYLRSQMDDGPGAHRSSAAVWDYWDQRAQQAGFVSLEVYLMLHAGYQASMTVHAEVRRYRIADPSWLDSRQPLTPISTAIPDLFPALDLSRCVDSVALLAALSGFLARYRLADIVIDDGGREHTHCGFSAVRLENLLLAKGMSAGHLVTYRFASGNYALDAMFGRWIEQTARQGECLPHVLLQALRFALLIETGPLGGVTAEAFARWCAPSDRLALLAYASRVLAAEPDVRMLISGEMITPHIVTTAEIGERKYLIDLNGIQFGRAYDRLLIVPLQEAAAHGFVLPGLPDSPNWPHDAATHRWLQGIARTTYICAQQQAMAEYLRLGE